MTSLSQGYEERFEKIEEELEALKKTVRELQLKDSTKEITIHPSAELGCPQRSLLTR